MSTQDKRQCLTKWIPTTHEMIALMHGILPFSKLLLEFEMSFKNYISLIISTLFMLYMNLCDSIGR